MLAIKVPLEEAEPIKRKLLSGGLLDTSFSPAKDSKFIYFPVREKFDTKHAFVRKKLEPRPEKKSFRESAGEKLTKEELELLKTSMDVVGTIAILEVPRELEKRSRVIAEALLKSNRQVKTVVRKGKHGGVFRTQELIHLAGENTKEAVYRENGVVLKVDVEKVYFSPRLSNERLRIMRLVKKGEEVLVMFSGCAPYVCVISKNTEAKRVDGVEINPEGHRYALENLKSNRLKNAEVFCGDVKEVVPGLGRKYDRIIMPLPRTADEYLGVALGCAKKGATIHFYDFELESEKEKAADKARKACKEADRNCKIIGIVKTGQPGPRSYRYCVDFRVD